MGDLLVVGIGNVLRGDDGVGVRIVEALGAAAGEGSGARVVYRAQHQLLIEDVDRLAEAARVVFVDAAMDVPPGECRVAPLEPADAAAITFHDVTPAVLLAVCASMHGRAPAATLVRIGAASIEAHEGLSPLLAARFDGYCDVVRRLATRP